MKQARRRAILHEASRDKDLVAQIPPVVAAGFGVLALRRLGDVLTVACFPRANPHALRRLREVLGVEIVATPFEDSLLHEAIRSAYFSEEASVNFPTFRDPNFLDDPRAVEALGLEKAEALPPARVELGPDLLVLATLSYRSTLQNLDARDRGGALPDPERTRLDLGELGGAGWRSVGGRVQLHLPEGHLGEDTRLVLTEYRASRHRRMHGGARLDEHEVRTRQVDSLPVVLHPTEVQLVALEADGALGVHVYDHVERVAPGRGAELRVDYHFLSYGSRMQRRIAIEVHEVECVPRVEVDLVRGQVPWGARELARWFGLG
jgi:hypothetical protein